MPYTKTNWTERLTQYNNRFRLVPVEGTTDQYDLVRVEGTISQAGKALSPSNLNNIENGLFDVDGRLTVVEGICNLAIPSYDIYRDINGTVVFDTNELGHENTEYSTDTYNTWVNTGKKITANTINAWFLKINIEAGMFPTSISTSSQGITYSFRLQLDNGTVIAQTQIDLATAYSGGYTYPNTYVAKTALFDLTKINFTRAASQNLNLWVMNDNSQYNNGWHPLKVRSFNLYKNQMVKVYDYTR